MIKKLFMPAILFVGISLCAAPLPEKTNFEVVVDTDGAIDDMTAIAMLLSRPEVIIKGILTSEGTLLPGESYSRIKAVLDFFGADSIPVAAGPEIAGTVPAWREFNMGIKYGRKSTHPSSVDAGHLLSEIAAGNDSALTLLCLGPLTNIRLALEADPALKGKLERIIWYRGENDDSFNYSYDTASADFILASGIPVVMLSNKNYGNDRLDAGLLQKCKGSPTTLASFLKEVNGQPAVKKLLADGHFIWYDELAVFYLLHAELFDTDITKASVKHKYNRGYNSTALREVFSDMITGNYTRENNVVFLAFPEDASNYTYDVREIMDSAIMLYGPEEWKANVMTDEFHGHLGVFSIVGAKMGTKAKEIFGVQNDQLKVVTYAGLVPPYSCLTDGIQVSTGATLGMGTISLGPDSIRAPMAVFSYKGRSVKMTLKPEYLEKVNSDINEGIVKFGMEDDGYWKLVRRNALRYWLEWDRNNIFIIEETE